MKKYFVLFASACIYLCIGINYSWSVFAQELKAHYGFTMAQGQSVFSIFQLTFPVVFFFGGRVMQKFGPVTSALAGSLLFGGGFALAGILPLTSLNLILTIGVISGAGLGLSYAAPIYASQKNFPDKKAIVTGITVAAFAISAVIFSLFTESLYKKGWSISNIFLTYGIIIIVIGCFASLGLRTDGSDEVKIKENPSEAVKIKFSKLVTSKLYWALTIPFFSGVFAGLMIFGNIKSIGIQREIVPAVAAIGISSISLFNAAGRITWGYVAHYTSEAFALKIALMCQAVVLIAGAFFLHSSWTFILFAGLVGFNYGANLVLYPSLASRIWGVEAFGTVYPFIFIGNAFAGFLSPSLAGIVLDVTGDYFWSLIVAGVLCVFAFAAFRQLFSVKDYAAD
ncbi:MAG: MFS transporter [Spirochaetes bacterium]|nr:MFS transporter [Spirochaetota bacterium]